MNEIHEVIQEKSSQLEKSSTSLECESVAVDIQRERLKAFFKELTSGRFSVDSDTLH